MEKQSRFKFKYVFLLFVLLIGGLFAGGWYMYKLSSEQSILLDAVIGQDMVYAGEPFDLKVRFGNDSKSAVNNVEIAIRVPNGLVVLDSEKQLVVNRDLGDIAIGGMREETFELMALPSASGSSQKVTISATYLPGPLSSRFEKTMEIDMPVAQTGFKVAVTAPEEVFSGEDFSIETTYERIEGEILKTKKDVFLNVRLQLLLPDQFTKKEASPAIDVGAYQWGIGTLANGNDGMTTLSGNVSLQDNQVFDVTAQLVADLFGQTYVVAEDTTHVLIKQSPLGFQILLNDDGALGCVPGETLFYTLYYVNNTDISFRDTVITATLDGEMFDMGTLDTKSYKPRINTSRKEIAWDSVSVDALKEIEPEETGTVEFSINLRNTYPIRRLNDKNFVVALNARIESPSVPEFLTVSEMVNTAKKETKVKGQLIVEANGYFRDAVAGILNDGPFPPKVGQSTQYTIHWTLKNYGTDVKDIVVKASLEDGVVVTGVAKSNTDTVPEFNTESGEITWKIDRLLATTGVISEKPEAFFQIQAVPRPEYVGKDMLLLSATNVTAVDEFTDTEIQSTSPPVTTLFPADKTTNGEEGIVQ
ncbi:MAG: hypothetical protein V1652_00970 [bacterium]